MNTRTFFTVFIVAGLTVGAAWWFTRPAPAPAPEKIAEAPKPDAPKPKLPVVPAQVAAPTLAPAPKSAEQPPTAAPAAAPTGDPRTELNTALTDIGNLLQSGDMASLLENYMNPQMLAQIPPEQKAMMEQQMQQAMQTPQGQQQMQMMVQVISSLKDQTPELNDAGDHATYHISPPPGSVPAGVNVPDNLPISFVKIDGRWYIQNGEGGL